MLAWLIRIICLTGCRLTHVDKGVSTWGELRWEVSGAMAWLGSWMEEKGGSELSASVILLCVLDADVNSCYHDFRAVMD